MIKRTIYFGNPAYLSTRNKQLVIDIPGIEGQRTIPIEDIGFIVVDHPQVTITNCLLMQLAENNTIVITCDTHYMPTSITLPIEGNSLLSERIRIQVEMSEPLRKNLWNQTVYAKIYNQAKQLENVGKSSLKLLEWLRELKNGIGYNHESYAAAYYFQNLFGIDGFSRNEKEISPNQWLNYGYAILRSVAARAICGAGLMPSWGIFHKNRYNAFCLADDLMEPYRPYVDKLVCMMIEKYGVMNGINKDQKAFLLTIPAMDVFIDGGKSPLMIAMGRTINSYLECLIGKRRKLIFPIFNI